MLVCFKDGHIHYLVLDIAMWCIKRGIGFEVKNVDN